MKQTLKSFSPISFALIIVAALSLQAFAHDKAHNKGKTPAPKTVKGEFLGKGDGVKSCPVTGEDITNKDVKGRFFNRTVYFCCAACLAEAKKSPAAYLKRTQAAQVAATKNLPKSDGHHGDHAQNPKEGEKQEPKDGEQKFLGKGDGIETCPVMGSPVNKDVKYEVNGRVFYVCCPGCAEVVKKDPDLYLKPVEGEKKKETAFLGKGDGIESCPVMGSPVNKDVKYEVNGRVFYVCCPGCAEVVKKDPDLYLKPVEGEKKTGAK